MMSSKDCLILKEFQQYNRSFPLNEVCPVDISWIDNPNQFWIRHPGADKALSLISHKYFGSIEQLLRPNKIHNQGIYLYIRGDSVYRIKLSTPNEGQLMDTGESNIPVHFSELYKCPSFLREIKPLAFQSSLADVKLNHGHWGSDIYKNLRAFLSSRKVKLRVKVVNDSKNKLLVFLFDQLGSISEMFHHSQDKNIICYITKDIDIEYIQFEDLKKDVKLFGKVVHSGTGLYFYFVLKSKWNEYQKGINEIQSAYNSRPQLYTSNTSFVVVAKLKSKWARCIVLEENESGYRCYDIDSGEEMNGIRELYKLYEDVASLPCYVHLCELVGYNKFDEDDLFIGRTLIQYEEIVDICVKRTEETTNFVDIYV